MKLLLSPSNFWKNFNTNEKVGTPWLCFVSVIQLTPAPPRFSRVFVLVRPLTPRLCLSHCINSVTVMSGMCINSDLPVSLFPSPPFPPLGFLIHLCIHPWPLTQNGSHNQDLLVCACAVGVATCFGAPIGGKSRSARSASGLRSALTSSRNISYN